MEVNPISRNNYSIKTNNNSKLAFKGKEFAKVFEKFDPSSSADETMGEYVFRKIQRLLNLASKEPGFQVENWKLYKRFKNVGSSNEFWSLFDELYYNKSSRKCPIIARDSQGPLIKYGEKKGVLEFLSEGQYIVIGVSPQRFGLFHTCKTKNLDVLF